MTDKIIAQRYVLKEELGSGGMGTVYQGMDTPTGQIVAIKQLKSQIAQPKMIERFKREGEALRELNHPNIVKMLDAVEEQGDYYLVMEYVSGGDLKDLIKQNGKLGYQRCVDMAIDLADALTRAHRLNIIHRDLKPANVLIANDGTVRLTDFGIAHIGSKDQITDVDGIIGTIDYLSPETLNGEVIDTRTDIWAFGVMLFEMLVGKRPFGGDTLTATISAVLTGPLPDLEALSPDLPTALIDLVYRMLERDPQARISSVRYVGAALEDILQGRDHTPQPTRFETPLPDTFSRPKHNLPAQTTPFVGREHELAEVDKLIRNRNIRLITVLAPGGMGKTRLALETGRLALGQFSDGVYFVDLAPLNTPESILSALAQAVDYKFQPGGDQRQQVLAFLANRQMLLIMDNYEHLLDGSSLVTEILQAAPQVQIIATSRQRLNQVGETLFQVSGMDFPDWETPDDALQYAAVKLFMQSAKRVQPDFELTAGNMNYIARICKLVQGMPLGIVLAAGWLGMLPVEEIALEIARDIDFLASEMGDLPERQRSIRAVFDYSWNLMTAAEQQILMKLGIFRGGFTRQAAQSVAGATLYTLMSLVNKSLIQRAADSGRFSVHELLRQYAENKLKDSDALSATHEAYLDYFTEYLNSRYLDIQGRRQFAAKQEINLEANNIRNAWQMALDQQDEPHLLVMGEAWALYVSIEADFIEGMHLLRQAVDTLKPGTPTWDSIACWYEFLSIVTFTLKPEYQFSEPILQRARQRNDRKLLMRSLVLRANALMFAGDPSSFALMQEGIALATEPEDSIYRVRMGTMMVAFGLVLAGQLEAGYQQMGVALDDAVRIGDLAAVPIIVLELLPRAAIALNRHHELLAYLERAIAVVQSPSDRAIIIWGKSYYEAYSAFREGNFDKIKALYTGLQGADFRGLWHWDVRVGLLGMIPDILGGNLTHLLAIIAPLEQLGPTRGDTLVWAYWLAALAACASARFGNARNYLGKMRQFERTGGFVAPEHPTLAAVILALEARQRNDQQRSVELLGLAFENAANSRGLYMNWPFLATVRSELQSNLGKEAYNAAWERGKSLNLEASVQEVLEKFGEDAGS